MPISQLLGSKCHQSLSTMIRCIYKEKKKTLPDIYKKKVAGRQVQLHRRTYPEVRRLLATCPPRRRSTDGVGDCFLHASNLRGFNWLLLQLPSDLLSQTTTAPQTKRNFLSGLGRGEGFPRTDLCCRINTEPIGRKNTFMATDISGFSWYFCCDIYCFIPFHKSSWQDKTGI